MTRPKIAAKLPPGKRKAEEEEAAAGGSSLAPPAKVSKPSDDVQGELGGDDDDDEGFDNGDHTAENANDDANGASTSDDAVAMEAEAPVGGDAPPSPAPDANALALAGVGTLMVERCSTLPPP
jgi:hypothetical protein